MTHDMPNNKLNKTITLFSSALVFWAAGFSANSYALTAEELEGDWTLSPVVSALGVGPSQGDISWWSSSVADLDTRDCLFDDIYRFRADGTFANVMGSESWVEGWQGVSDSCATPVAPHNGSATATYGLNGSGDSVTITGLGAYLGLPKVVNGGELSDPAEAVASITYSIVESTSETMTLDVEVGGGAFWRFLLAKDGYVPEPPEENGLLIEAESYASVEGDVDTEGTSDDGGGLNVGWIDTGDAMLYTFNVETAGNYSINYRVASQNGSSPGIKLFIDGVWADIAELPNTGGWQNWETVVGRVVTLTAGSHSLRVEAASAGFNLNWLQFTGTNAASDEAPVVAEPIIAADLVGNWTLLQGLGALGVGPDAGNTSWWVSDDVVVAERYCLFDDVYVFGDDGSFTNQMGSQTWVEQWQGIAEDSCATPVAPHDGGGSASYSLDMTAGTLTINGVGAHLGIPKAVSGAAELTDPADAPASIVYEIYASSADTLTLAAAYPEGYWTFKLVKQEPVTAAEPLVVLDDGAVGDAWDLGLAAYDQEIDYSECTNHGVAACPNIGWEIVNDADNGSVLEISHSSAGQVAGLFAKTSSPINASAYAGGNIIFDVKVISGSSELSMKIDCVYPCSSGNYNLGSKGASGWETVTVAVNDLVSQDLDLSSIDTGIVVWATAYTDTVFRIDNVRWEADPDGPSTDNGGGGSNGSVWVNPNFSGYTTPESYAGYSLIWSDEFSGTALNTDDWTHEVGTGNNGWGNNELQFYKPVNTSVQEGLLVIEAKEEAYSNRNYTSSRIKTQGKFSFKYGRVDIRAAMPQGKGLWPALWMLGENISTVSWPQSGEIDIMEMVGGSGGEGTVYGTAHWNNGGVSASYSPASYGEGYALTSGETLATAFHVFSLVWTETSLTWYIDDTQYHSMTIDNSASLAAFREEFFLLFNVAVGGDWPGSPNSNTSFPQRMLVDYVRVFQPVSDSDGDGYEDDVDAFPQNAQEWLDTDADGTGNNADSDDDGDSLPDSWETANNLDPLDASDASSDADNDGISALEEYNRGDDPNQASLPAQVVTIGGTPVGAEGTVVSVSINYNADLADNSLPGLGFRLHFNSQILTVDGIADLLATDAVTDGSAVTPDVDDEDNNPATDSYISFAWASVSGAWPGGDLPQLLATVQFLVAQDTGVNSTTIGFSELDVSEGYRFIASAYEMPVAAGNWDFDGNGQTDALTDGLLFLRYTFGLRGDVLTNGVVANDATFTTAAAIEVALSAASEIADIDGNGQSDALTDGLLLLRYLFGLRGESLINGVVSSDGSRTAAAEIEAHLAAFALGD